MKLLNRCQDNMGTCRQCLYDTGSYRCSLDITWSEERGTLRAVAKLLVPPKMVWRQLWERVWHNATKEEALDIGEKGIIETVIMLLDGG